MADVMLLSVESRSLGYFSAANLMLGAIIIAGAALGVYVGHWPIAVAGLVLIPFALYWQGRSVARRLLRSGVMEDLRTTPHGQTMILANLDEFCNQSASRALFSHLAIFASVVAIRHHQTALPLLPALAAMVGMLLVGGGLYFGAAHAGQRDGLRIHTVGQQLILSFEALLRSLAGASLLVVLSCGSWWIYLLVRLVTKDW
jgi:hypothetical protein